MTRLRAIPIAIAAVAISTGAVFAYKALPEAASTGLDPAAEAAGRDLPTRPDPIPAPVDTTVVSLDDVVAPDTADLPDAAEHGAVVSEAAKPVEPPGDSDHGKDVSEVARDNHGAATVEEHKPADAGKPDGAGQPDDPGPPDSVDIPDAAPEDPGPPADPGEPEDPGRPN